MTETQDGATATDHAGEEPTNLSGGGTIAEPLVPQAEAAEVTPPAAEHPIASPVSAEVKASAADVGGTMSSARSAIGGSASSLRGDVQDRLVAAAEEGKARAGDALQSVAQMLFDAADQVDARIGASYGDHVRHAGTAVEDFAADVRQKELDEFAADLRGFIARSPAAAVGIAATLGFALARVVHAGVDQRA